MVVGVNRLLGYGLGFFEEMALGCGGGECRDFCLHFSNLLVITWMIFKEAVVHKPADKQVDDARWFQLIEITCNILYRFCSKVIEPIWLLIPRRKFEEFGNPHILAALWHWTKRRMFCVVG